MSQNEVLPSPRTAASCDLQNLQPFANVQIDHEVPDKNPLGKKVEKNKLKRIMQLITLFLTIYVCYKLIKFIASGREGVFCQSTLCKRSEQHLLNSINFSVNPCDNFYEFACGNWKAVHQLDDKMTGTNAFRILQEELKYKIQHYLDSDDEKNEPLALHQARKMYRQCLDEANSNKTTLFGEIAQTLQKVNLPVVPPYLVATPNFSWFTTIAKSKKYLDLTFFIEFEIQIDPNNSTIKKLAIGRPERLLPFSNQPANEMGIGRSQTGADRLRYKYLKKLVKHAFRQANLRWPPEMDQIFAKNYELFLQFAAQYSTIRDMFFKTDEYISPYVSITDLQEITDQIFHYNEERIICWKRFFEMIFEETNVHLDFKHDDRIILVPDFAYIVEILNLLATTPMYIVEYYMWIEVTNGIIPYTNSALNKRYNDIYRSITGDEKASRETFCYNSVKEIYQSSMAYFLVRDNSVKKQFKKYQLNDNSFLQTIMTLKHEKFLDHLTSYHRSVSEDEWWNEIILHVDTYYSRDFDAIALPVGILKFPFYQLGLKALDYGAIGMIIGHEMTHAFDALGLKRDTERNLELKWSLDALSTYEKKANCFVNNYYEYTVGTTHQKVDGLLTLDENLADNEGLRVAYQAFKNYMKKNGREKLLLGLDHYTPEQLFFLAFANTWCEHGNSESMNDDTHSPRPVRVMATLRNSEDFAEAWKCKKGSPMNPDREKCKLW
ncbi:neprilysin-like isoform X2 [Planococcus citri]|uniref:neprilysin-like isoform X2 n=1 Tax=Planococcus citri TaxID=170843 RepID=UPI0031F8CBEE